MKIIVMLVTGMMMLFNINITQLKKDWDIALEKSTLEINSTQVLRDKTLEEKKKLADNIMSWQLDNGGWTKDMPQIYTHIWDGKHDKSKYYQMDGITALGTIDNEATLKEVYILSAIHKEVKSSTIEESILKAFNFLLEMQYATGAFPQVYPKQDSTYSLYENMATYNDDATVGVLTLFQKAIYRLPPFDTDVINDELRLELEQAYHKGIDFILKSQIEVDGKLTGWCAQHNPWTYQPVSGRPFEPVSISGQESVVIAKFLQTVWPRTERTQRSIDAFVVWLEDVAVEDVKYYRYPVDGRHFVKAPGKLMWYRFYEIGTNRALFADSDGRIYYSIDKLSLERRKNYGYAGDWGRILVSR